MKNANEIGDRVLEAVLAGKLGPGSRLGEQELAALYGCSRTIVREALTRLSARGIVTVEPRRGWFVVEPTNNEARSVFEARQIIETGLLRSVRSLSTAAVTRIRAHIERQRAAIAGDDAGLRSLLLGDFHVCLAECLGNAVLAATLRDLTARTTMVAARYQSVEDAVRSFTEHEQIVVALEEGDYTRAEQLMAVHLGSWEEKLHIPAETNALHNLREALRPIASGQSTTSPDGRRTPPSPFLQGDVT